MSTNAANPKLVISAEDRTGGAFRSVMDNLQSVQTRTGGLLQSLGAVAPAFAAAFTAAGLVEMARGAADAIDALNDVADATGASVERISALESVALRTGANLDDVSGVLIKFNAALKEADGKNGVSKALEAIGLNAAELRTLDPADALQRTAQALANFADDGNKARIQAELFGKGIGKAAPFLKDLAEAGQINATTTAEQAAAAEKFNKQLFAFQANSALAKRAFLSDLLPSINEFATRINLATEAAGGFFAGLGLASTDSSKAAERLAQVQKAVADARAALAQPGKAGPLGEWITERAAKELKALETQESYLKAILNLKNNAAGQQDPAELARRGRGPAVEKAPSVPDIFGPTAPKTAAPKPDLTIPQALQDAIKALDNTDTSKITRLRDELQQLLALRANGAADSRIDEAIANTTAELEKYNPGLVAAAESQRRLNELLQSTPGQQLEAVRADMVLLAAALERGAISAEQFNDAVSLRLTGEAAADQRRLNDLLGATPTAQLEQARSDMELLAAALERGVISAEQFSEAATARLSGAAPELEKTKSVVDELGLSFNSAFESAVRSGKGFSNVLQAIGQDLLMIATRETITKPLFELFKSSVGGGGLVSLVSSLFGGGRATGGSTDPGKVYRVNELGPELLTVGNKDYLMMGSNAGSITPHNALQGGGGVTLNLGSNTYHVGQGVSMAQVAATVSAAQQAQEGRIRRLMREGALA